MLACFHFPDFPAWAFTHSARTARSVVVIASGRVVAAGAAARRDGVERGMSGERARTLSPEVAVYPRDAGLEAAAWEEALDRLHTLTPFLEDAGPGWAFLRDADPAAIRLLAARLGAQVGVLRPAGRTVGSTDRRGGAFPPNVSRTLARLAALQATPGRALSVDPRHADAFLARFPVADLLGLGFEAETLERLGLFGYPTLGAAASLSLRQLRAQFGGEGERLHALLHPSEEAPIAAYRLPPTATATADLDAPLREPGDLLPILEKLVADAAARLGALHCRRLTLRVSFTERQRRRGRITSRVLPEATQAERPLATAARALLLPLLSAELRPSESEMDESGPAVEALTVELGGLEWAATRQASLFGERPSVHAAVRGVHRRFPGAVKRAVLALNALFEEDAARFEPFPEASSTRR